MKKNKVRTKMFVAVLLAWGMGAAALFAAEKTAVDPAPKASPEFTDGQNTEKLIYTLNETLQENRKIRQSMRDLQDAFEKVTLDKSDVVEQMKKVEKLAIQRSRETSQRIDELNVQLDTSKKEIEKLQGSNKLSAEEKLSVEKKLQAIGSENAKMQGLLKDSILATERDQILARMKQNEKAVQKAVTQVSSLDGENIALKQQLVQSYFDLGNMFYDLGRYEDSAAQYLHVLEWNPYHAWAHHNLAIIYDFHLHKNFQAIEHYKKYLSVKSPEEEAEEARLRLWDLEQLAKVTPGLPLKMDFDRDEKL